MRVTRVTADDEGRGSKRPQRDHRSFGQRIVLLECYQLALADHDFHDQVVVFGQITIERNEESSLTQRFHLRRLHDVEQYNADIRI